MIIKTLRWKIGAFNRLVQYAGREMKHEGGISVTYDLALESAPHQTYLI